MYKNKKILAVIPARGGSKGIPRKNIIDLCGKPLIAYTIESARKSKYIDDVIVSTDDEEIKDISKKYKAEVPFLRPAELSDSNAKSIDVVLHTVDFMKKHNRNYDYVILLQPTSPLRDSEDIDNAIIKLLDSSFESLVSVCETTENPVLMRTIENNHLKQIISFDSSNVRRQEFPKFYIYNGAIYINTVSMLYKEEKFIDDKTMPFIMDNNKSIDIDNIIDLKLAGIIIGEKSNG